ncbi:extracellular solute-binding protein [bacterium]|nr:extracellular solute-binding protein [bacterium]
MKKIAILILLIFAEAQAEQVKINLWHQMLYSNRVVLREVCDAYEKQNPNVKIQLTYRETEELRSNFQSSAMGGSGPELIYGPSDQVGPFASMEIIKPLDEFFDAEFFKQFDPNAVVKLNGKTWMVGDMVGNHLMLIYNKELLPNPPQNTDELIEFGKNQTKDTDGDGKIDNYGLVWNFTEPFFYVPWLGGFGSWFFTETNQPNLNTPQNIEGFKFIKSLRDEHKIVPKECDYEVANALFKSGKAAMIINGDWSWGDYTDAKIDFGIARIPLVSQTSLYPNPLVGTKGYSINSNVSDKKIKPTLDLLRHLTSKEVQLKFTEKVNLMPSNLEARKDSLVLKNEILRQSAFVMEVGKPMPVVPEIRAVWDALRTQYQAVLGGNRTPEEGAKLSQANAEKQIREMNEILKPNEQATVIKWLFPVLFLLALVFGKRHFTEFLRDLKKNSFAYFMAFPAFFGIFAVIVYPFFYNLLISVSNFSLRTFQGWEVIGFQNYLTVFQEDVFYTVLWKTVLWTAVNLLFHVSLGVFLAVLINRTLPAKKILRTLLIIPWAVPQYITALTWRGMFNQEYGAINLALSKFFAMTPVQWLSQPFEAFSACVVTNIWLGFPFMMVIALGGLQSIPQELYEAARVDGATKWQQFWKITLPMLKPVMIPAITLGTIWTFNNINVVWLVSNAGEPSDQTHILVSYVYKAAFNLYRYGYAAALSMVIFLILLVFGVFFLRKTKATDSVY